MLCQKCGKRTATVVFTQVVSNTKTVMYLCEKCAQEIGISVDLSKQQGEQVTKKTSKASGEAKTLGENEHLRCPTCRFTYAEFKENGRLGCGDCYTAFSAPLEELLTKLHGSAVHMGKAPLHRGKHVQVKRDIILLRKRLKTAIKEERFEEAAKLRDKLAIMERMNQSDN